MEYESKINGKKLRVVYTQKHVKAIYINGIIHKKLTIMPFEAFFDSSSTSFKATSEGFLVVQLLRLQTEALCSILEVNTYARKVYTTCIYRYWG